MVSSTQHVVNIVHKARFPSSLVINQYMRSENSSSECSQVNSITQYGCWDSFTLSKYSLRQSITSFKTAGGVYDFAKINGQADGFLTCSGDAGIKRSRYTHQLTLASLTTQQMKHSSHRWIILILKYRKLILRKSLLLQNIGLWLFLRRSHESKFDLFKEMLPWLAALDHIHYLRWGLVFLNNMKVYLTP